MDKSPFLLEQIVRICGFETQFTTNANITNKQLLVFYEDISKIIKELDKDINYEGDIFKWRKILNPFQFSKIEKALQVRNNHGKKFNINDVARVHNINYCKNPKRLSKKFQDIIKNNQYGEVLKINPNLKIVSTNPSYNINDLFNKIKKLPYVKISKKYAEVFDINEIINYAKMLAKHPPIISLN